MSRFYHRVVSTLLAERKLDRDMKVLVVCGGDLDRQVLLDLGFQQVTISNLDNAMTNATFAPFESSVQDAEDLTFADDQFDFVIVRAGLHHCRSPHRALLEMYRVASKGILVLEARDSFTMRLACRLGFALDYELPAVSENNWSSGGVRNSCVPNFVYRWKEREFVKTLASYNPEFKLSYRFFYGLEIPYDLVSLQSRRRAMLLKGLSPLLSLWSWIFPAQGNCFAFWAKKPELPGDLQPWLKFEDDRAIPDPKNWQAKPVGPCCRKGPD